MEIAESWIPLINIVLIAWLIIAMIIGYIKGFIWELLKLLGLFVAVLIAWITAPGIATIINLYPKSMTPFNGTVIGDVVYQRLNFFVWFVAIMIICLILLAILRPLLKAITEIPVIKELNGALGAVMGLVETFVAFIVLTYLLNSALISNGKDVIERTMFKYVDVVTNKIVATLSDSFDQNVAIQKMISDPLSLQKEDLQEIVDWLNNSKLSADQIKDFLNGYGINPNTVNELLGNG